MIDNNKLDNFKKNIDFLCEDFKSLNDEERDLSLINLELFFKKTGVLFINPEKYIPPNIIEDMICLKIKKLTKHDIQLMVSSESENQIKEHCNKILKHHIDDFFYNNKVRLRNIIGDKFNSILNTVANKKIKSHCNKLINEIFKVNEGEDEKI